MFPQLDSMKCPICREEVKPTTERGLRVYCKKCKFLIQPFDTTKIKQLKTTVHDVIKKIEKKEDFLFIDVRNPDEREIASINGTVLIPLTELPSQMPILEKYKDKEIVVHCHHGGRSMTAAKFLHQSGFKNVKSMDGGIDAWSLLIDNSVERY